MSDYHKSVFLRETIEYLRVKKGQRYIDATLGGGGHSFEILNSGGKVLGIDQDQDALDHVREKFKIGEGLVLAKGNFREIDIIAKENGFEGVSGIVYDLGVSSYQLDTKERGFSFQTNGPLDMRMDREMGVTASDLINSLSKNELSELFFKLGEERFGRVIADRIVKERKVRLVKTTNDLVDLVKQVVPRYKKGINPATKVFQALRIATNDEINNLRESLPKSLALLGSGGRIVAISFHSLEDRVIKHMFKEWESEKLGSVVTKKPLVPTDVEVEENNRSRSAKLRVFERE